MKHSRSENASIVRNDEPKSALSTNPRDLAAARTVRQVSRFPELDLAPLDVTGLSPRDAALARAIDHVVARHWITLVTMIRSRIERPWDRVQGEIRAALLIGAAQVFYMDGIPDHAAVDHAVEWTKREVNAKAGGFVNAIMRALVRVRGEPGNAAAPARAAHALSVSQLPLPDGRVIDLTEPVFAEQPMARLAQQTSHAEALIGRWMNMWGEERTRELAMHSLVQPPIIMAGLDAATASQSELLSPHEEPGFFIYRGEHGGVSAFLESNPGARVQDPSSAAAVKLARGLGGDGQRIADLCAGHGTKTTQLAQAFPTAKIFAGDPDRARFASLKHRFPRGHAQVSVIGPDEWIHHSGTFDLVVIDVPCSNTGVLSRRPEAKYRFSRVSLEALVALQRQIIIDALRLRSDTGRILYATCSLDHDENERQMEWVEAYHAIRRRCEHALSPSGLPGGDPAAYRDGGYAALLEPRM